MTQLASPPAPPASRPRSRWRRRLLVLLFILLLPAGAYLFVNIRANRELAEAVAAIERSDPRWRLEDIETDRAALPDAENAAVVAMGVKPMMPSKWPIWDAGHPAGDPKVENQRTTLQTSFSELEPQRQLNKEQLEILRAEMKRTARARDKARLMADMPQGRYPITYSADFIGTLLPHIQNTREVANVLAHDVLLQAQEEHFDQAMISCRAILNAARSIGNEPLIISQLVRYAIRTIAVHRLQRILAQGEPADADLKTMQQLLEQEEAEPLLLFALRGERAGSDLLMTSIETGKVKLAGKELGLLSGLSGKENAAEWLQTLPLRLPAVQKSQHAALLRYMTRAVEIARMPVEQQQEEMEKLDASAKSQPLLVRLIAPALSKIADAERRSRADLRCAVVAVAAERYRHQHKKWPAGLEALRESGYLHQVPADPYDGQPLRLRRTEDGLRIYAVGPDGQDNGGRVERVNFNEAGTDRVFRLWGAAKRRQEAALLKPVQPPAMPPLPPGADAPPEMP